MKPKDQEALSHKLWAMAQLPPEEGVKDGSSRIKATPAHRDAQTSAINEQMLEALKSALWQCLAWQGETDETSCSIHSAVVKEIRAAITAAESHKEQKC